MKWGMKEYFSAIHTSSVLTISNITPQSSNSSTQAGWHDTDRQQPTNEGSQNINDRWHTKLLKGFFIPKSQYYEVQHDLFFTSSAQIYIFLTQWMTQRQCLRCFRLGSVSWEPCQSAFSPQRKTKVTTNDNGCAL